MDENLKSLIQTPVNSPNVNSCNFAAVNAAFTLQKEVFSAPREKITHVSKGVKNLMASKGAQKTPLNQIACCRIEKPRMWKSKNCN